MASIATPWNARFAGRVADVLADLLRGGISCGET
jgi:hypothetical protein